MHQGIAPRVCRKGKPDPVYLGKWTDQRLHLKLQCALELSTGYSIAQRAVTHNSL